MDFKSYFSSLSQTARIRLIAGAVLILVLTGAALWWVFSPRHQLLFGKLREADAAEIVQSLNEWKVPYKIIDGGASITVPSDMVYETRMRLVSAGVPRGGHVGFELFDDSDFGVTEFAQRVNYQRALQGEIERTIAALPGVDTARVHLTIRRPGLFVGERETSKASVALTLHPGESLTRQQISGIRSLVAAAVEGLSSDAVSVLDSDGALLAGSGSGIAGQVGLGERDDEETRMEEKIRARVSELLSQVLRNEEFRVSVDVLLNFDTVREVNERPLIQLGEGNAVLVRKRTNSSDAGDQSGRSQNQEEAEYAHGVAREEISRAPGRVERISIAVILPPTLDEVEVARIQSLIGAAAGIDADRGDRLEVSRLGRGQRMWRSAADTSVATAAHSADPDEAGGKHPAEASGRWALSSWKWVLVATLGILLGAILAVALQRRPRALESAERDAVLGKLRVWLADGKLST